MIKLPTTAQMHEMDHAAIYEYGVPGILLMENAAQCIVDAAAERFGPLRGKRITVVCGKGNNGGDGLAVARHLATRCGSFVTVLLASDPGEFSGDAALNYAMAQSFGLPLLSSEGLLTGGWGELIVDALLGTGIRGGVSGRYAEMIESMNRSGVPILSIDVPSGLDSDIGTAEGPCIRAMLTVTLALPKFGLMVYPGAELAGEVLIGDIGMPRPLLASEEIKTGATEAADISRWLPSRINGRDSNKGQFGHVTVFAGSAGFAGAPVLTAEAAARTGSGLVTLVIPEGIQNAVMARISPVVMTRGLPQTSCGSFAKLSVEETLKIAERGTAAALGPGLGGTEDEETRAFVREFVSRCPVPLVIDADALNCLASESYRGVSVVRDRPAATVLTPHPGEMGRLLGTDTKAVQADRRGAVERAAKEYGCVVLLKGARTLIADEAGRLAVNTTSNPGMATGGAGDALTGIITALMAGRLGPWESAAAGAYLHGLAGDLAAAAQNGCSGLIATDIIQNIPQAIARCHS